MTEYWTWVLTKSSVERLDQRVLPFNALGNQILKLNQSMEGGGVVKRAIKKSCSRELAGSKSDHKKP